MGRETIYLFSFKIHHWSRYRSWARLLGIDIIGLIGLVYSRDYWSVLVEIAEAFMGEHFSRVGVSQLGLFPIFPYFCLHVLRPLWVLAYSHAQKPFHGSVGSVASKCLNSLSSQLK